MLILRVVFAAALCISGAAAQQSILFEGARLITGDGSAPIENSAFLMENNKFTRVGKRVKFNFPPARFAST